METPIECKQAYCSAVGTITQEACNLAYLKTLGERIRTRRKNLNMPQADLAKAMRGTKRESLSQWENDIYTPEAEGLLSLARVLGVSPQWLLTGKGEPGPSNVEPSL